MNEELTALGQQLCAVRHERELSLDDVARATRIRRHVLESIESGEFDPSLTDMQLRGFLRNYAAFLRLDLDAMLEAYRQMQMNNQNRRFGLFKSRQPEAPTAIPVVPLHHNPPTPPQPISRVSRGISSTALQSQEMNAGDNSGGRSILRMLLGFIMGISLLAVVAIAGLMALGQFLEQETGADNPESPLMVEEQENTPTAGNELPPKFGDASPTPLPTQTAQSAGGILISTPNQPDMTGADSISIGVEANQRSWLRLTVDGQVEYESILRPGTGLQFKAQQSITLRTSNAAGLNVVVNNQSLGTLGGRGELYEQTFTLGEAAAPGLAPQVTTPQGESMPDANLPTPIPTPPLIATDVPLETPVTP